MLIIWVPKISGRKAASLRGSVMLAGPLLARFKKAYIPKPGGDKIGRRKFDTHIIGFEKLGANLNLTTIIIIFS